MYLLYIYFSFFFSKIIKKERYKFKCITEKLKNILNRAKLDVDDDAASDESLTHEKSILQLLILINNLINETKHVHERIRIRYEFIGLNLNDLFKAIRYFYYFLAILVVTIVCVCVFYLFSLFPNFLLKSLFFN